MANHHLNDVDMYFGFLADISDNSGHEQTEGLIAFGRRDNVVIFLAVLQRARDQRFDAFRPSAAHIVRHLGVEIGPGELTILLLRKTENLEGISSQFDYRG